MDRRHPWLRVLFVLLLVAGIAKGLNDLHKEAERADDPGHPPASGALFDFRDTVYNPTHDLLDGHDPYDHVAFLQRHPGQQEFDTYAPSWFTLTGLYALPPYHVGQALWWLTIVFGVALTSYVSLRIAGIDVDGWRVAGLTGLLLLSLPGQQVLRNGQQSFLFAACLVGALLWARTRPWAAAGCLLLLTSKPQLIGAVGICLALGIGAWRAVARGAVLVVAASVIPLVAIVVAAGGPSDLATHLSDNLDYASTTHNDLSASSPLQRIDVLNIFGKLDITKPTTGLQLVVAAAVLALAVIGLRRLDAGSALALAVLTLATLLSLPHFPYDLALLVPAIVVLAAGARGSDALAPAMRWGLVALMALPLAQVYQVDQALDRLGLPSGLRQSIASICLVVAFGLTLLAVLAPRRAAVPVPS